MPHAGDAPWQKYGDRMNSRTMRRRFVAALFRGLAVVWPILSGLLAIIVVLGIAVGRIERWSVGESIYFAFVSALTVGYGDFAPEAAASRLLAVLIGICGVLTTAVLAAVAVKALPSSDGTGADA
jgi:hypothetical protein